MKQISGLKRKNLTIIILLLALVVVIGVYFLFKNNKKENPTSVRSDCTKQQSAECELLNESLSILPIDDRQKLMNMQPKIVDLGKYTNNANFMYIVTAYYIKIEDPDNAIKYYDLLKKAYAAIGGYDSMLEPLAQKPDSMQPQIEYMMNIKESIQKNSATSAEPQ